MDFSKDLQRFGLTADGYQAKPDHQTSKGKRDAVVS